MESVEMVLFQLLCFVLMPMAYHGLFKRNREAVRPAILIFFASWIGEASAVYFYGFYHYSELWWFRIAGVPLLIPLIWPMVILSGREVLRALWPAGIKHEAWALALLVFIDASLIEVVSVRCGLWSWVEPGYLGVPLIGVAGWAWFALAVMLILRRTSGRRQWWVVPGAPIILHLLLVASWWIFLKWHWRGDWFWQFAVIIAILAWAALRLRRQRRMSMDVVRIRLLAAGIFGLLLLFTAPLAGRVWLHVLMVSVPYTLLTRFGGPAK